MDNTFKHPSATDIIDISLNVLKSDGPFTDKHCTKFKKIDIDPSVVVRAWAKLERDGFAYSKEKADTVNSTTIRYYITLDGVKAVEDCPFFLRGRPYKWKMIQNYISITWKVVSLVAIILNALIILLFTYLTYLKP